MNVSSVLTIREGTTSPIKFQLLSKGVAIPLTGIHHLELHMQDSENNTYKYSTLDTSPAIVITDVINAYVDLTPPDATTFRYLKSPYSMYVWLYVTATSRYSIPEDSISQIVCLKDY